MQKTLRKPVVAAAALAAGAAIALTGCSSDDSNDAKDAVTSAASAATSAIGSGASQATSAAASVAESATDSAPVDGLDNAKAQDILRTAVNPDTPADEVSKVVDTSTPGTEQAITGYAKGSAQVGYTPDVYTVKAVESAGEVDGNETAKVIVAVVSPHARTPEPIDIDLTYVKVDGDWKLSADAVTALAAMGGRR